MKTCSKCGEEKPLADFPARTDSRDGRRGSCASCEDQHQAEYRAAHREKARERSAAWRKANPERARTAGSARPQKSWDEHRLRGKERNESARNEALKALGGACVRCGYSNPIALQIDHVFSDAAEERKEAGYSRVWFYRKVVAQAKSGRYQLLCANHNWEKRAENDELAPLRRRRVV